MTVLLSKTHPKCARNTDRPCWSDWIECSQEAFYILRWIWNDSDICRYYCPYGTDDIRPIWNIISVTMRAYFFILLFASGWPKLPSLSPTWSCFELTVDIFRIELLISPAIKWHWNEVACNGQFVDLKHFRVILGFVVSWPNELLPNRIHFRTYNLTK